MRKKYSKERFYKKLHHVKREKAVMMFRDELLEWTPVNMFIVEDEIYYSPLNLTLLINGEAYE